MKSLIMFLLLLAACTPLRESGPCILPDRTAIGQQTVLMPEECLKRVFAGSTAIDCSYIRIFPDSASVYMPLPSSGGLEYRATHQILESGILRVQFPYSTREPGLCIRQCAPEQTSISGAAVDRCLSECDAQLVSEYGKTEASFPVTILLRFASNHAHIVSINGQDPDPVPGKKTYAFRGSFNGPLRCIGW